MLSKVLLLVIMLVPFCLQAKNKEVDLNFAFNLVKNTVSLPSPTVLYAGSSPKVTSFAKSLGSNGINFRFKSLKDNHQGEKLKLDAGNIVLAIIREERLLQMALKWISWNNLGVNNKVFVFMNPDLLINVHKSPFKIKINQEILFVSLETLDMFDIYTINESTVQRNYGSVGDPSNKIPVIEARRNNFAGTHIKVITEHTPPYMSLKQGFRDHAPIVESSKYYLVTDHVKSGLYYDVLNVLSTQCNFTYDLYKRLDNVYAKVYANGSTGGMIRSVVDGDVDIVGTSLGLLIERMDFLDFLPVISFWKPTIFVKNEHNLIVSWSMFLQPFSGMLWIALIALSIAFSVSIFIQQLLDSPRSMSLLALQKVRGLVWATMAANFSGGYLQSYESKIYQTSSRMIIGICLIFGNVFWSSYNGALTSKLATEEMTLPFNSFETLLETNYIMGVWPNSGTEDRFKWAPKGSLYNKIYEKNMRDFSKFMVRTAEGAKNIMTMTNYAYYANEQSIVGVPDYDCKITSAWKARTWFSMSMATSKNSPLHRTLSRKILEIREGGMLFLVESKHLRTEPKCTNSVQNLGMEKVVSLFVILWIGILSAIFIFVLEKTRNQNMTTYSQRTEVEACQFLLKQLHLALKSQRSKMIVKTAIEELEAEHDF